MTSGSVQRGGGFAFQSAGDEMKKAWRTTYHGTDSIYACETRGQAVAKTLRTVQDIVNPKASFTDIRAIRAPQYDGWAEVDATGVGWNETFLPKNK